MSKYDFSCLIIGIVLTTMLGILVIRLMIMKMIPRMNIIIYLMMIKVGSIETTKGRMSEQRRGKNTGEDEDEVDRMTVFMMMMMMMMMMVTQHIPTSHIPNRWEYVIMMKGGI